MPSFDSSASSSSSSSSSDSSEAAELPQSGEPISGHPDSDAGTAAVVHEPAAEPEMNVPECGAGSDDDEDSYWASFISCRLYNNGKLGKTRKL